MVYQKQRFINTGEIHFLIIVFAWPLHSVQLSSHILPFSFGFPILCSLMAIVCLFFLIRLIAPCQGNQDSLGFWNPRRGFRISGTGFQSLSVELGFWIPSAIQCDSGFLSAVFWIQKPRIADSTSKNFPDSTNQILCLHEMRSRKALNSALHETRDFKMPRRRRQRERQKSN